MWSLGYMVVTGPYDLSGSVWGVFWSGDVVLVCLRCGVGSWQLVLLCLGHDFGLASTLDVLGIWYWSIVRGFAVFVAVLV